MEKLSYGGIDVSKDRLDVVVLPEGWFAVSNDTATPGRAGRKARARRSPPSASSRAAVQRGVVRALLAAGLWCNRVNPNKLRQFARARGVLAKNDRLMRNFIAEYRHHADTSCGTEHQQLERLARDRHHAATAVRRACRRRPGGPSRRCHAQAAQQTPPDPSRRPISASSTSALGQMVATNAAFAPALRAADLDAPASARCWPSPSSPCCRNCGKMSRKQIAALVEPHHTVEDSGQLRGHRSIYGGRMQLVMSYYMAALSASRYNPALRAFSIVWPDANRDTEDHHRRHAKNDHYPQRHAPR